MFWKPSFTESSIKKALISQNVRHSVLHLILHKNKVGLHHYVTLTSEGIVSEEYSSHTETSASRGLRWGHA